MRRRTGEPAGLAGVASARARAGPVERLIVWVFVFVFVKVTVFAVGGAVLSARMAVVCMGVVHGGDPR